MIISSIIAIAARDVTKLARDKIRLIFGFMFPFIFIGILGQSLNSNLSDSIGLNLLLFTFLGVLAQTLFQSTASGVISLVADRENDFAQEMFVAPIPRWAIIVGKIVGESCVSFILGTSILILGVIMQIPIDWPRLITLIPVAFLICVLGGAFGVLVMSNLSGQQAAQQVFPFVIFPQIFLAGVFNPIHNLPPILFILSRISPLTYGIDLFRGLYYLGKPEYTKAVLFSPITNLVIIAGITLGMLIVGTVIFTAKEKNR